MHGSPQVSRSNTVEPAADRFVRHVAGQWGDLPWLDSGKLDLQALRRLLTARFTDEPA